MEDCIFCKIGSGKIPSFKVDETDKYIAFMDIFPPTFNGKVTMPVVLIAPKKHLGSNVFEDISEEQYLDVLKYTRKVAKGIQKALSPARVCLIFEGMEINHLHPKLYPIFDEFYPGFLSTEKSPGNKSIMAGKDYLESVANKIKAELSRD